MSAGPAGVVTTRTPLRVTLGGGGTDLESYYRHGGGFIFAMALDKYIHVHAHRPVFDRRVVVNGATLDDADPSAHPLVRAALRRHDVVDRFELASLADIAGGTGLGSSSCFLVGLLNALHAMAGRRAGAPALAEEACALEINALARGIGKQDQYMAAFGGLTTLRIAADGTVAVAPVVLDADVEAAFLRHTHIYYTGLRRDAAVVLSEQNTAMADAGSGRHQQVQDSLDYIRDLGYRILAAWQAGDLDGWGRMLDEHWQHKKRLSSRISWPKIDALYESVKRAHGVLGGKVIGAGGGGFLMLFCPGDGTALQAAMHEQGMPRLRYAIDRTGSRVLSATPLDPP
ncbi:MAG: hypothetical protein JO209_08830 [Acidisphaera sp.]|nr:hypothetical protein [Acidisphaera sp.]